MGELVLFSAHVTIVGALIGEFAKHAIVGGGILHRHLKVIALAGLGMGHGGFHGGPQALVLSTGRGRALWSGRRDLYALHR